MREKLFERINEFYMSKGFEELERLSANGIGELRYNLKHKHASYNKTLSNENHIKVDENSIAVYTIHHPDKKRLWYKLKHRHGILNDFIAELISFAQVNNINEIHVIGIGNKNLLDRLITELNFKIIEGTSNCVLKLS